MKIKRKNDASIQPEKKRSIFSSLDSVKVGIATCSMQLLEDPQENIELLAALLKYMDTREALQSMSIEDTFQVLQWAMLSLLAVFKDILPGYRIHLAKSENESGAGNQMKLTKEVKKLQEYESRLLRYYETFVKSLFEWLDKEKSIQPSSPKNLSMLNSKLSIVAVRSLCDLLQSRPFFNCSQLILGRIVPLLDLPENEKTKICYDTMTNIFQSDETGEISLEAINIMCKLIQKRPLLVEPRIVQLFVSLRLLHETKTSPDISGKIAQISKAHVSKKRKKVMKTDMQLNRDLEEANALQNADWRESRSRDALNAVVSSYLRILSTLKEKLSFLSTNEHRERTEQLLEFVFQGLEAYMHLLPMSVFLQLQNVLKEYIGSLIEDKRCSVYVILLALQVLSKLAIQLETESSDMIIILYRILKEYDISDQSSLILLSSIIHLMLIKKRHYSHPRIAAFLKRLSRLALRHRKNPTMILYYLKLVYALSTAYKTIARSLFNLDEDEDDEDEYGNPGADSYQEWMEDPDLSVAHKSTLREIKELALKDKNEYAKALLSTMQSDENHVPARYRTIIQELATLGYESVLLKEQTTNMKEKKDNIEKSRQKK